MHLFYEVQRYQHINYLLLFILFQLPATGLQAASLPQSYGIGPRAISHAGGGTAFATGPEALFYNAAGLTPATPQKSAKMGGVSQAPVARNHTLSFSYTQVQPLVYIKNQRGSSQADKNAQLASNLSAHGIQNIGISFDLRRLVKVPYEVPTRVGLVFSGLSGKELVQNEVGSQKRYNFMQLGRNAMKPDLHLGMGIQPWEGRLSLGVGIAMTAIARARLNMSQLDTVEPLLESDVQLVLRPRLVGGLRFRQPLPFGKEQALYLAGSYRQASQVKADIQAKVAIPYGSFEVISQTYLQVLTYYTPETVTGSFGYQLAQYKFSFDVDWQRWSKFALSRTFTLYEQSPGFRDVIAFRGGYEGPLGLWFADLFDLRLRLGFSFVPAFTPDQVGASNYLDNDKYIVGFGLHRAFKRVFYIDAPFSVSWGLGWQAWQKRKTLKEQRETLPGGSLQPDYVYGGNLLITSLAVSFEF